MTDQTTPALEAQDDCAQDARIWAEAEEEPETEPEAGG